MTDYEKTVAFWQRKNITMDAELAEALNGHSIAFAYNSGKLENEQITYHDTREVFEHDGVTSYTGDLRTLFEIRNAKDANELFLVAFGEKRKLGETLIKEFHACLTKNTYDTRRWQLGERPGEYKHHDYVTGKEEIGAPAEDVKEEMRELLSELQDVNPQDVLTAGAYFHAKLENIHPFADGNGRTGRLIMFKECLKNSIIPFIIDEQYKFYYYRGLKEYNRQKGYLLDTCLSAQDKYTEICKRYGVLKKI